MLRYIYIYSLYSVGMLILLLLKPRDCINLVACHVLTNEKLYLVTSYSLSIIRSDFWWIYTSRSYCYRVRRIIPEASSAVHMPASPCLINNSSDVTFYCSLSKRSKELTLLNAMLLTAYLLQSYEELYLVTAYSLSPLWRLVEVKVPMQPRRRRLWPIFQVTNKGLKKQNNKINEY